MSQPDDVLLGRAELERAFTALGERLAHRGVVADIFVVGGKASAARTRDIDDLRLLAGMIGVATADAALQICADFYPDEPYLRGQTQSCGSFSADPRIEPG